MAKLTKTQRFVLECLHVPGHVPEPKGRYTLSLRILEERGLVGHSMNHGWYIKQAGRAVLEEVTMRTGKQIMERNRAWAAREKARDEQIARLTRENDELRSVLSGLVAAMWALQTRVLGLEPTYRKPSLAELRVLTEMLEAAESLNTEKETG